MTSTSAVPGTPDAASVRRARHLASVEMVAAYLESCGYRILDRNWQHDDSEVAVVAADQAELVVVDVTTRTRMRYGRPLGAISGARTRRLRRLAQRWLTGHGTRFETIRVDAAGVIYEGTGGYTIEHVKRVG